MPCVFCNSALEILWIDRPIGSVIDCWLLIADTCRLLIDCCFID